jgi:hypothetical protein
VPGREKGANNRGQRKKREKREKRAKGKECRITNDN